MLDQLPVRLPSRRGESLEACAAFAFGALWLVLAVAARGGDWPAWRYDAGRTGTSPEELPAKLYLQWALELPTPRPAWPPTQRKLQFDAAYEPIVAGTTLFVPSMVRDRLTAYDTETGKERWRFYANGPVRFAPVAWHGKVYFVSDDGCLYCVDAGDGRLVWRFRGGPSDRAVLGNGRLISTWPARGAPVIVDGTVYFAAGIWPFMGIFIHALDAATGKVVWENSGSGSAFVAQQHGGWSFAGVAPQGYLAATDEHLLVAGGRTVPAVYERKTGKFLYFHVGDRALGRSAGGYGVTVRGEWFLNHGAMYALADGAPLVRTASTVVDDELAYSLATQRVTRRTRGTRTASLSHVLVAHALDLSKKTVLRRDRGGKRTRVAVYSQRRRWQSPIEPKLERLLIRAGRRLYGAGEGGFVAAVDLPSGGSRYQVAEVSWSTTVRGTVWNLLAGDGKLFVVTREGAIYCFGGRPRPAGMPTAAAPRGPMSDGSGDAAAPFTLALTSLPAAIVEPPRAEDASTRRARRLLAHTGAREGVCLLLGLGDGRLADELARLSALHVVAVEADAGKVLAARRRLDDAGLYGTRVAVVEGEPASFPFPPYLASLIVAERFDGEASAKALFRALRPYGGVACVPVRAGRRGELTRWVSRAGPSGARVAFEGGLALLTREGPLPGSADWTHQYADAGNSVASADARVKLPLGLLWFGGSSNEGVLVRHGHGPSPQVAGGRLFIEGRDLLRAVDVYTGRVLWERALPELGAYFHRNEHHPGAGAVGSNYVSTPDGVYVAHGRRCLRLDPATGEPQGELRLPPMGGREAPHWGYLGVSGDLLIATGVPAVPLEWPRSNGKTEAKDDAEAELPELRHAEGSRFLVALDRHTGAVLWRREATYNFRHNAIALGAGKVFCTDDMTPERLAHLRRRGRVALARARLLALDARTGAVRWELRKNPLGLLRGDSAGRDVFGTWLAYSAEHDVLVQATSRAVDRSDDEAPRGLAAYRGADGSVLWADVGLEYSGPPMLVGDTIVTQADGPALDLRTGRPRTRTHPLTHQPVAWSWSRQQGCNTAVACRSLLLFRSGAAGYFDLDGDGGTGSLGGFRSGCTSNLIPANGLLNAPDYTRGCSCSYQNQTSLAMVHDPDAEMWTWNPIAWDGRAPIRQLGLNLGAPGDRRAANGTLWLDAPSVGGPSPEVPLELAPADGLAPFRLHSSRIADGPLRWVAASGIEGLRSLAIPLGHSDTPRPHTVRLVFAEPRPLAAGRRVFSVALGGKTVLRDFDIVAAAGAPRRSVVRELKSIPAAGTLTVELIPLKGAPLLCGIEILAED